MAAVNQGGSATAYRTLAYDNPSYLTRVSASLGTITGSGGTSTTKFTAFTQLTIYGVTFFPVTALGSSTYTVNGTSTTSAMSAYCVFITNTSTTATISLATTTVSAAAGPFIVAGTGTAGSNVSALIQGGIGGYSKYPINTLGGTNTTMAWGTTTYTSSPAGGNNAGIGGLYMNPGDQFYVVAGTDATGTASHILEYSIGAPTGTVVA